MKNRIISLLIFTLSSGSIWAANTDQNLQQAVGLLQAELFQQAYERLLQNHEQNSQNPQEWFLLGIAAKSTGRLKEATRYFEKLLEIDANAPRVKLELVEIAYWQGNSDKAKQLLLDVQAANPPANVTTIVNRFIASIAASEQQHKNWRLRASAGWMHDSNANAGPDTDSPISLFGLPFTLSTDSKQTSDNALVTRLGFDYMKNVNNSFNWQSNLSASLTDYRDLNNLDALYLSFSTGAAWRQSDNMFWLLPVIANRVKIGHDSSYYSYSYGVVPQARYLINDKLTLAIGMSVSKKKYQSSNSRDLTSWALLPSLDYKVSERNSLRLGLTGAKEDSGLDIYSNDLWGVNALYFHNFSKELTAIVRVGYGDSSYREREAAYTKKRHDKTTRLGLDLTYFIAPITSELIFSVNYTKNKSNLPIYEYSRSQTSFSLQKAFY